MIYTQYSDALYIYHHNHTTFCQLIYYSGSVSSNSIVVVLAPPENGNVGDAVGAHDGADDHASVAKVVVAEQELDLDDSVCDPVEEEEADAGGQE